MELLALIFGMSGQDIKECIVAIAGAVGFYFLYLNNKHARSAISAAEQAKGVAEESHKETIASRAETATKLDEVAKNVDGKMELLLDATKRAAKLEGRQEGQAQTKDAVVEVAGVVKDAVKEAVVEVKDAVKDAVKEVAQSTSPPPPSSEAPPG